MGRTVALLGSEGGRIITEVLLEGGKRCIKLVLLAFCVRSRISIEWIFIHAYWRESGPVVARRGRVALRRCWRKGKELVWLRRLTEV